jgi:hypothetical protein
MPRTFVNNYYDHSKCSRGSFAALLAFCAAACGASNNQVAKTAPRVPIAHIATLAPEARAQALARLPVILEIRKGDTFPIEPLLESRLVALHTEGGWTVEALETFYVLLPEEGAPVVSLDGVDFEQRVQNSFGAGFEAKAGQPPKVRLAVKWYAGAEQTR